MEFKVWQFLIKAPVDVLKIIEAEKYISDLLEAGQECIDILRSNNEVEKKHLIYFWMSKNIELKEKRSKTSTKKQNNADDVLRKLKDEMQSLCDHRQDTLDHDYQVCYEKSDYIVIWIQKMQGDRKKPARWYQIACSKKDAPLFHEYCTRLPRAEKY